MVEIEIVETDIVVPSEETPRHTLWLSNMDQKANPDYTPTLYVYRRRPDDDRRIVGSLKSALAKALVHFYPLAGRLDLDGNGRCEINCSAEGAQFVVAQCDGALDGFGDFAPSPELRRMFTPVVESPKPPGAMLFMTQVTFFKCGGMVLGTAIHHIVVDGQSALHFIGTWADIARGVDPAVKPHLDRTLLRARSPPTPLFDHPEYKFSTSTTATPKGPTASVILHLSKSQVIALKHSAVSHSGKTHSTFRAVTGHVWRSLCIARGLSDSDKTRLYTSMNVRNRMKPQLPPGFFGNAISRKSAFAVAGEIISKPVGYAAERIRESMDRVDDQYVRSLIDYLESDLSPFEFGYGSTDMWATSWLGLPLRQCNLGWGEADLMVRASLIRCGFAYIMDSAEEKGGVSVPITVEAENMERFKEVFYGEVEMLVNGVEVCADFGL